MASILRSAKFVRYVAGFARNIVINPPREFDGNLVQNSQCFCGGLQRYVSVNVNLIFVYRRDELRNTESNKQTSYLDLWPLRHRPNDHNMTNPLSAVYADWTRMSEGLVGYRDVTLKTSSKRSDTLGQLPVHSHCLLFDVAGTWFLKNYLKPEQNWYKKYGIR